MIASSFGELAIVLSVAGVLGIVARLLKQPTMIAYLTTGLLIGPLGYLSMNDRGSLELMGHLGITLLLFMVGLEMNFGELKRVGKVALLAGLCQIGFTAVAGFGAAIALGFGTLESFYIGMALTFSSTILAIKLLSERKELNSLHGKIAVGFLLVQDFVAIVLLIVLAGMGAHTGGFSPMELVWTLSKAAFLFYAVMLLGKYVLPRVIGYLAKSEELLFLTSIAWALGFAYFVSSPFVGFSIEIGGFLAGLSLAASSQHYQIDARMRSLRDFFVIMFFVVMGSTLAFGGSEQGIWLVAGILGIFVLVGNPLIVMAIMGMLGYRKRTSFLTGIAIGQVSEFSLILMALGGRLGYVGEFAVSVVTIVGVASFVVSSYLIMHADRLYAWLEPWLGMFERAKSSEPHAPDETFRDHVVVVGAHRIGQHILAQAQDSPDVVIVDYNPEIIEKLKTKFSYAYYGDIADPGIRALVNLKNARLVVSTIPDVHDNLKLLDAVGRYRAEGSAIKAICHAGTEWEAKELYEAGADYVILPHFVGGKHLAGVVSRDYDLAALTGQKEEDLKTISQYL